MDTNKIVKEIINIIKREGLSYAECERLLGSLSLEIKANAKIQ